LDLDLRNETYLKVMLAWKLAQSGKAGARVAVDPLKVLGGERQVVLDRLHELGLHRTRSEREGAGLPTLLLLDLAISRLEAMHKWLDRCEAAIRGDSGKGDSP